jgi:hypothetical protein
MIDLKQWMELINYKITEGSEYQWQCFGHNAYALDSQSEDHGFTVLFDRVDQTVYEVQAFDYARDRAYRMINPEYAAKYNLEVTQRGVTDTAWDGVEWTDLETDDDFIQKCQGIQSGEDYDTRVSIPLEFTDDEMLRYMIAAHKRDLTFNQYVEMALREAIEEHKRDPEAMRLRAEKWKNSR